MTWTRISQSISLVSLVLTFVMCTPEVDDNTGDLLIGRWELQEASRNGRITASLDDLYFEFYEDGSMRTNLSGATETAKYELDASNIRQTKSKMDTEYAIEEISDSTLLVNTDLRGYSFRFLLARSTPEQ